MVLRSAFRAAYQASTSRCRSCAVGSRRSRHCRLRMAEGHLAVVAPDQPRTLRDQQVLAGGRVVHAFGYAGDDLTRQVRVDPRYQRCRDDRTNHYLVRRGGRLKMARIARGLVAGPRQERLLLVLPGSARRSDRKRPVATTCLLMNRTADAPNPPSADRLQQSASPREPAWHPPLPLVLKNTGDRAASSAANRSASAGSTTPLGASWRRQRNRRRHPRHAPEFRDPAVPGHPQRRHRAA